MQFVDIFPGLGDSGSVQTYPRTPDGYATCYYIDGGAGTRDIFCVPNGGGTPQWAGSEPATSAVGSGYPSWPAAKVNVYQFDKIIPYALAAFAAMLVIYWALRK